MRKFISTLHQCLYYAERLGLRFYVRKLLFYELAIANLPEVAQASLVEYKSLAREFVESNEAIGWLTRREAVGLLSKQGFIMCGAFIGERLVGNCWLELHTCDLEYLDLYVELPAEVAYISRVFVAHESRGSGISEGLIHFALTEAARLGKTVANICCVPSNTAMRHILPRLGFTFVSRVTYTRAMLLRIYRFYSRDGVPEGWTCSPGGAGRHVFG